MRWCLVATLCAAPAWADDEAYARSQLGRMLASEPESRLVTVAEPPREAEPLRIVLTVLGGMTGSQAARAPTVGAFGVAAAVQVWAGPRSRWFQLVLEPRMSVLTAVPLQFASVDFVPRFGLNTFFDSRLGLQLRAGLGAVTRVTIADSRAHGGVVLSGEGALVVRAFDDERVRLKFSVTATAHAFLLDSLGPGAGATVVAGVGYESEL